MAGTVTVACKIPNGLRLRVFKETKVNEPVMGGGTKEVSRFDQIGDEVVVRGPAVPFGATLVNGLYGYALTTIDADFWAKWKEQNKDHDAVRNGLIFASAKPDEVKGVARECENVRSGLEPLEQKGDPRTPRKQASLSGIEVAERSA